MRRKMDDFFLILRKGSFELSKEIKHFISCRFYYKEVRKHAMPEQRKNKYNKYDR